MCVWTSQSNYLTLTFLLNFHAALATVELEPRPTGSTLLRDPQALNSTLTALGTLQPLAFESLNRVDPLDSVSNYYIVTWYYFPCFTIIGT